MTERPSYPDFTSPEFLNDHISKTLGFYEDVALDPAGGFFHSFRDDGTVADPDIRHLVSSCRFVFNYALAYSERGDERHRRKAEHGLAFLQNAHLQPDGSYAWLLNRDLLSDGRVMGYGQAYVMIAAAYAMGAGIEAAGPALDSTWQFMDRYFWEEDHGAYADEYSAGMAEINPYRGQNANMHSCEACIAAFRATGDARYLNRAETLARKFTVELPALSGGMIWEHYHSDWTPDPEYNRDKPNDLFKPWGIQPGHLAEWARLLLMLDNLRPESWYLTRATELFAAAMAHGRDSEFGGIVYSFAPDGTAFSREKYFWVHSECAATAWRLYRRTGEAHYLGTYNEIWRYAWDHLVDHEYGAWYRVLTSDGRKIDDMKSPPGKTDYHTLGVCWDILSVSE